MSRVAVGWQSPRQVAVSPGGVLLDPAGWTRTLWTLQTHLSRFSLARSAATLSIPVHTYDAVSFFAWTFLVISSLYFLPFPVYVSSHLLTVSHQPDLFSDHLFNPLFIFEHWLHAKTHIYSPVSSCTIYTFVLSLHYTQLAVYSVKIMQSYTTVLQ